MKIKFLFLFCTITFFLTSCGEIQEIPTPVMQHIVVGHELNESITVSVPEGWNTYKVDEIVSLAVILHSSKPVYLSEDNIRAEVLVDNNWIDVNTIKRKAIFEIVLYYNEIMAQRTAPLLTKIDLSSGDYSNGGMFRFFVTGYIFENQVKGDKVYAYVEVELFP